MNLKFRTINDDVLPVPVAARSKAYVFGRSPAEIVGSNPTGGMDIVCCECCVLSDRGLCNKLITRPEESYRLWCVIVCDLETSRMRRPWPALSLIATEEKKILYWKRYGSEEKDWSGQVGVVGLCVETWNPKLLVRNSCATILTMTVPVVGNRPWTARAHWNKVLY